MLRHTGPEVGGTSSSPGMDVAATLRPWGMCWMEIRVRPARKGIGARSANLSDLEWRAIQPLLPKPRGIARVDDRRVLNGILWRLRTGRSWAAIPDRYAPAATCHARFIRWRDTGIWARIVEAGSTAHRAGQIELIDAATACVPAAYHHAPDSGTDAVVWLKRSAA